MAGAVATPARGTMHGPACSYQQRKRRKSLLSGWTKEREGYRRECAQRYRGERNEPPPLSLGSSKTEGRLEREGKIKGEWEEGRKREGEIERTRGREREKEVARENCQEYPRADDPWHTVVYILDIITQRPTCTHAILVYACWCVLHRVKRTAEYVIFSVVLYYFVHVGVFSRFLGKFQREFSISLNDVWRRDWLVLSLLRAISFYSVLALYCIAPFGKLGK